MEHERAVANAIAIEAKKDGLQQRQDGSWTLRLTIASTDMDSKIVNAPMGTRYQCVLVEISDDETPVEHVAKERDKWRDLGAAKQAGMRCKEPTFWAFLREEYSEPVESDDSAAIVIRRLCGVLSRSDLNKPGNSHARLRWHGLDNSYQAWKAREHAT